MESNINASAQKEQGGEAGDKELVVEAMKVDPGTVVEQLPLPFKPTVTSYVEVGEERIQDVQRKGIPVDPLVSGPKLTTPPFTGRSEPPDHLSEIQSGRSLPISRSTTSSSEDSLDLTPEHVRSLKKKLKEERRYSRELEAVIRRLDLANPDQPTTQVSHPIQAEQDLDDRVDYEPPRPSRCESDTHLVAVKQTQLTSLESEVKRLKDLLYQAFEQTQTEHEIQQELKSQLALHERENTILQKGIEERDIKIEGLIKSQAWLSQKLKENEEEIEILVHEDQFDKIYRFVEAKSSILVEGDRCIVCDNVPDKCVHMKPEGQQCNYPSKKHTQTRLRHKFKAQDKEDKCNYKKRNGQLCDCSLVQHQDLEHSFKGAGLCQSHLYPKGVLEVVCKENNRWIYDGVDHTSRTPKDCKRRLICALCEPVTSKLENGLIHRMKHSKHRQHPDDQFLFSLLAYRSMVFSLHHYQEQCCVRYRADIKAIMQYGWSCHHHLRYPDRTLMLQVPVLLYLQSPSDDIRDTLHLPAVCELDLTAVRPPPPSELGNAVVAIYGCIPPYHYILLRDLNAATKLQTYSRQITLSVNRRLSKELEAYYEENIEAKTWLDGQRRRPELGQHWWPILTFGHLKCCLNIQIE